MQRRSAKRAGPRRRGVSFTLDRAHAHDVATLLDRQGIAVRAGHHCAEPLMHRLGLESTARASFGVYTTRQEIDSLADGLSRVRDVLFMSSAGMSVLRQLTFDDLRDLYQEVILDHGRRAAPRQAARGRVRRAARKRRQPDVRRPLSRYSSGLPRTAMRSPISGFEARGCAISHRVRRPDGGEPSMGLDGTDEPCEACSRAFRGDGAHRPMPRVWRGCRNWSSLQAARGRPSQYPSRVKCATLAVACA